MEITLDFSMPVPADDVRRDFVPDRIAEHGRVPGTGADGLSHTIDDVARTAPLVEKRDVLFPRQADHHIQAVTMSGVEQPARRDGICAETVGSGGGNLGEIALNGFFVVIFRLAPAGTERPIRDPANIKFAAANIEEFSNDARARNRSRQLPNRGRSESLTGRPN